MGWAVLFPLSLMITVWVQKISLITVALAQFESAFLKPCTIGTLQKGFLSPQRKGPVEFLLLILWKRQIQIKLVYFARRTVALLNQTLLVRMCAFSGQTVACTQGSLAKVVSDSTLLCSRSIACSFAKYSSHPRKNIGKEYLRTLALLFCLKPAFYSMPHPCVDVTFQGCVSQIHRKSRWDWHLYDPECRVLESPYTKPRIWVTQIDSNSNPRIRAVRIGWVSSASACRQKHSRQFKNQTLVAR